MDDSPLEYESDLVDLSDSTLREVMSVDESVLGHALRRLWRDADQPDEIVARFGQGI